MIFFLWSTSFPCSSDGKICLQCRRPRFDPWVRKVPWRREWQPTPVFWPGKSHEQRSLTGYSPWGRQELDTIERIHMSFDAQSFINVLSFTVASDGDLNISAFPTLGAQKHSCLNSSTPHLPITVSVGFPSSMHLWKLPHKMIFLYPCWAQLELTSEPS